MNFDQPSRDQIEARITALLLGELPAEEAELLQYTISQDSELQKLHDELKAALPLIREAEKTPADAPAEVATTLKLSLERRQKLLEHFKQPRESETPAARQQPEPLFWLKRITIGSRLVEILGAVAVIALLAAMLLPALSKAKMKSQRISTLSMARQKALETQIETDDNLKRNSLGPVPQPSAPAVVTIVTKPQLAPPSALPPNTQIVLPPAELPPDVSAQSGASQQTGKSPVYSQHIVGYVNIPAAAPAPTDFPKRLAIQTADQEGGPKQANVPAVNKKPADVTSTGNISIDEDGRYEAPLAAAKIKRNGNYQGFFAPPDEKPSNVLLPAANTAVVSDSFVSADRAKTGQNTTTQERRENVEKQWILPHISGKPVNNGPVAGIANAYASSGGSRNMGAGIGGVAVAAPTPASGQLNYSPNDTASASSKTDTSVRNFDIHATLNGFYDDSAGQPLSINSAPPASPAAGSKTTSESADSQDSYVIKPGDTLTRIARQNHTTVRALKEINSLDSDRIAAGATLKLSPTSDSFDTSVAKNADDKSGATNAVSEGMISPGLTDFEGIDLNEALNIYGKLTGRTVLHGKLPDAQIVLNNKDPMTKTAAIQTLQAVLAVNGISVVNVGDKYVKALPSDQSAGAGEEIDHAVKGTASEQTDLPVRKPAPNTPVPQREILARDNNFSTFSLNVSDVSFKFAEASLQNGKLPDTASIRSEEFINAFDYRDPEAAVGQPMAFASERAHYPFAHNRDLLRFAMKTAATGRQQGRALNLVLLLDVSGSMERADRVAIIHESLRVLATQLEPQDIVSVVTFSRTPRLWADGISGDKAGETLDRVGGITPEGGTNLEEAMRLAYETAHRHYLANGINRVVLLTDGAANLGDVKPSDLKLKVETQRKQGIALDCFGIGWEDYNDDLLEQLSSTGDGRYAFLNSPEDASKDFASKLAGALQIAAADVKVQVEFNPQRVVSYRQIGYATHQLTKEQFRDNTVAAGQIAAQEAGNALYTIETNPNGEGPIATVHVRYKVPGKEEYREHSWNVDYTGNAPSLDQSSPAMRLAATASAFSEWLAASPYAQEVTPDALLKYLSGVPEIYGADDRPKQLETMIQEARSLEGK